MANREKGEASLVAAGATYTLRFSVNALCELEDLLGMPVPRVAALMNDQENVRLGHLRAIVWAGLRDRHPHVDLKEAGEIAGAAGLPAVMEAVGAAFALAFPQAEGGAGKNPPTAKG